MGIYEKIRERVDILSLMEEYGIELKPAGKEYKALCPFHEERTPSFFVNPEKGVYHCFGCGASGDVFDFVMAMENVDFKTATEILAHKVGIDIEKKSKGSKKYPMTATAITDVFEYATKYYQKKMTDEAIEYLLGRGITPETIKEWGIGYANPERPLAKVVKATKEREAYIYQEVGIITANYNDRLIGRVIFPVRDIKGNVIALQGRSLHGEEPKYLHTKAHKLFDKSMTFYGIDKAFTHIQETKTIAIMEGNIDVVLAHQNGVNIAVSTMGTALTDKHFEILQAWEIKKIELWLDYDEAGLKAGFKHGLEAFRRGFDVEIVLAKEKGKDPADIFVGNATKRTLSIQKYIIAYLKKYVKELDKEKIITWAKEQRLKKKQVEALMQVIGYDMEEEVDNYEYENPYANPTPLELSYASIVKATLKEHPEFLNTTWEEIAPYPVITGEVIHDKREFLKVFFAWADMHHTRLYSLAVLNGDTEAMKEEEKILEKIHNAMRKEG